MIIPVPCWLRAAHSRSLSMNLPGDRIAACLGNAALKTQVKDALNTFFHGPIRQPCCFGAEGRSIGGMPC
jgi:hypothetical protein